MTDSIANEAQTAAWNGDEGAHWSAHADQFDRGVARHHARLFASLTLAPDHRVLDIGCGNGQTTRDAARLVPDGWATGLDLSGPMLAVARARAEAEGLTNVAFHQADAQVHAFEPASADTVISRFGVMFFDDPVRAFTNIASALRPGGRVALLAWQSLDRNEWLQTIRGALAAGRTLPVPPPGAPSPFSLADPERVREVFGAAGLTDVELAAVEEPIWFGEDGDAAFAFVSSTSVTQGLLNDLDDDQRAGALNALASALAAHATTDGVLLGTAAWLITARR
jgi:SAM-dependent methyltransferase